jgi:hypothetical protein
MDIIDNRTVSGRHGYKYVLVFVDVASRIFFVYGLKQKSDAFAALRKWCDHVSSSYVVRANLNVTLHCVIGSDNNSVFKSRKFVDYCAMSGYVRRYNTADGGPCQYAEAAINTLRAMSRCILNKMHLGRLKFWFLVLAAATYTYNRIGCDAFKGESPLER